MQNTFDLDIFRARVDLLCVKSQISYFRKCAIAELEGELHKLQMQMDRVRGSCWQTLLRRLGFRKPVWLEQAEVDYTVGKLKLIYLQEAAGGGSRDKAAAAPDLTPSGETV